ncbi:hypothetical protein EJ02DRAFT_508038 [Clathrospora elynae]|uniref:F-box domain-containing protein n=1 Tax=Clathrospora elynae TaxID=706981 RepID=A0A6A5T3P6_9PLEO|nr:hypothetical protein EJ02DRAFT_508038 [Clathrospora elynae]
MACPPTPASSIIKKEDSPEPEPLLVEPAPGPVNPPSQDPEGFLKRCSGQIKKTKLRCSAIIGKKSQQNTPPAFLPTCSAHRDQQSLAGRCQFPRLDGERCGRLFRWTPPYFELCDEHQGHPDTPCYLLQLPLELRHEIFRYLLPTTPLGSSTSPYHQNGSTDLNGKIMPCNFGYANHVSPKSVFPIPLLDLFLVSRQIYREAKDLLFSIATFIIDVRRDGTFMCGHRLLEPTRADGSSHFPLDKADAAKNRFLARFDWASVKNYTVDILLENWSDWSNGQSWLNVHPAGAHLRQRVDPTWDEEVEIYDIRDYVSVVIKGILAKSSNLCKLQVRLCLADFQWSEDQVLANTKLLVGPFKRLRNVRQANITGVFVGLPDSNTMIWAQRHIMQEPMTPYPVCSVPSMPTKNPVMIPGMPAFDAYATDWSCRISTSSSASLVAEPVIRTMFTKFRDCYMKLSTFIGEVAAISGKDAFLHRARVAREQEDVESMRNLNDELRFHWNLYQGREEHKRMAMKRCIDTMLNADTYPSHEWEPRSSVQHKSPTGQTAQSPILLDTEKMAKEGIPMTSNPGRSLNSNSMLQYQPTMQQREQQQQALHRQRIAQALAQATSHKIAAVQIQRDSQITKMESATPDTPRHQAQAAEQDQTTPATSATKYNNNPAAWYGYDRLHSNSPYETQALFSSVIKEAEYERFYEHASITQKKTPTILSASKPSSPMHTNSDPLSHVGEPGPSCAKKRRVDSGVEVDVDAKATATATHVDWDRNMHQGKRQATGVGVGEGQGEESKTSYVGKGKGKMETS